MAGTWGPLEHPVTEGKAPGEEGAVEKGGHHTDNYDATDGRHNKPDHEGWESVDPKSGHVADGDWASVSMRFPDGPGPWRQT